MSWLLFAMGLLGVLYSQNALSPRKRPPVVFLWSFFASWMTIELVWHHLVFGTIVTAVLVRGGALDEPVGIVGLVFMCMTGIVLLQIALTTRRTVVSVQRRARRSWSRRTVRRASRAATSCSRSS